MILTLGQTGESCSIVVEIVKEPYYIKRTTTTKQRTKNSRGLVVREMTLSLPNNGSIEFPGEASMGIALVKSFVRLYYRMLVPSLGSQAGWRETRDRELRSFIFTHMPGSP